MTSFTSAEVGPASAAGATALAFFFFFVFGGMNV